MNFFPLALKLGPYAIAAILAGWLGWEWRDRAADAEALAHVNQIQNMQLQAQAAATTASEQARALEQLQAERASAIAEAAALRNQEREVVERVITEEVIRYVESPDVVRVSLPGEWVRIHDLAATGRNASLPAPPGAAGIPYAIPAPVTDARALAVTTGNYATCHAIADQLAALQAWVLSMRLEF